MSLFQKYPIVFVTILYATATLAFAIMGDISVATKGDGFETLSPDGIVVWFPILLFSLPLQPLFGIVMGITRAQPDVLMIGIVQFTILFTLALAAYILTRLPKKSHETHSLQQAHPR